MPKCFDKIIQGFPFLGTFRTQDGGGGGATQPHWFQPGGFSISHSFFCTDLTHLQVDAEVEVARENEREQESEEAETEVPKCSDV